MTWTKKELQEHIRQNIWTADTNGNDFHGYGAAVVVAALYKKIYGDYPSIGLSGFQAEAAESLRNAMPESDMPIEPTSQS
jgi:hypothetical protein